MIPQLGAALKSLQLLHLNRQLWHLVQYGEIEWIDVSEFHLHRADEVGFLLLFPKPLTGQRTSFLSNRVVQVARDIGIALHTKTKRSPTCRHCALMRTHGSTRARAKHLEDIVRGALRKRMLLNFCHNSYRGTTALQKWPS